MCSHVPNSNGNNNNMSSVEALALWAKYWVWGDFRQTLICQCLSWLLLTSVQSRKHKLGNPANHQVQACREKKKEKKGSEQETRLDMHTDDQCD